MKTIGFLGYGKMNQMLVQGFLSAGAITPQQVIVSNRTREKVSPLLERYPEIRLMTDNRQLAEYADIILIGVRPLDLLPVLAEIRDIRGSEVHIISLAGCVRTPLIADVHPGKITRVLPSICSTVAEGISLCYHHPSVTPEEGSYIESLFATISRVKMISEELFEPAGDLTSCGPALITRILTEFAATGQRHSTLSEEECLSLVIETVYGTAKLLHEGIEPDDLISRVATRGGITEEGVKILEQDLPQVFDRLFDTTLAKHELVRNMVSGNQKNR